MKAPQINFNEVVPGFAQYSKDTAKSCGVDRTAMFHMLCLMFASLPREEQIELMALYDAADRKTGRKLNAMVDEFKRGYLEYRARQALGADAPRVLAEALLRAAGGSAATTRVRESTR